MKGDPRFGQLIGAQCGDLVDCRDEGVFGVIGLLTQAFSRRATSGR